VVNLVSCRIQLRKLGKNTGDRLLFGCLARAIREKRILDRFTGAGHPLFYETFLAAYDQKMREARGIYYTPEPVVSYIVRSVDHILKTDFGLSDGLADSSKITIKNPEGKGKTDIHKVLILDPAVGTGTFLFCVIDLINESLKGNKGLWSSYVSQHLLPRLFGFELLMAPYAVAHMKLGLQLAETGYDFKTDERLRIYLTNTLEEAHELTGLPLFTQWLAEEANAAGKVKQEAPVMVVLGNPPYSVTSQNKGAWISLLLKDYKKDLNEKKLNLDDDFIKFFRFAQWRIEQTGYGVLAFISNNTYLDGITHRRMRQSLMETFSNIYILNLHGSSKKNERCPDGSKDENVFDIQQGVSIGIFVRKSGKQGLAKVRHAELWGLREHKYARLSELDVADTEWCSIKPQTSHFFFVPKEFKRSGEYETLLSVTNIFPAHNAGIQTKRDGLVYHFTKQELAKTLQDIKQLSSADLTHKYTLPPDGRDWTIKWAQNDVMRNAGTVTRVAYHPFDLRWTLYTGQTKGLMAYPRYPLMGNALKTNLLFLGIRNARRGNIDSFFVANTIADKDAVSPFDNATCFPLYLYSDVNETMDLFDTGKHSISAKARRPNLSRQFIEDCEARLAMTFVTDGKGNLKKAFGPEDVFNYMYAIFHSPTYRNRYAEYLKIDFPRLPLPSDHHLFRALCGLGAELTGLHLMEKHGPAISGYPAVGDNMVESVRYTEPGQGAAKGRAWINETQYFEGVPPDVWEFQIGGYQVCQRWLKYRKGRQLTYDDLTHYQHVVSALAETIRLMAEIDERIDEYGGWPIK